MRHVVAFVAALGAAVFVSAATGNAQRQDADPARHIESAPGQQVCGTIPGHDQRLGVRVRAAVPNSHPVRFDQDPAILTPDYAGPVTFRHLTVIGDVSTIRFKLSANGIDGEPETWTRTGTDVIGGRAVSLFDPSWPSSTLGRTLRMTSWGWDDPELFWGEILPEGLEPGHGYPVQLRIASARLPRVQVARLADDVQYSSHVVNIVIPGFGDGRISRDESDFEFEDVTRRFYEHIADRYDVIAVVPADTELASFAAFHGTLQSDVRGIGAELYDDSALFGSTTHRLHAVELFTQGSFATNRASAHEVAHQWGSYFDWTRLVGLERSGHQPSGHDPLWAGSETRLGAVLEGTRRVRQRGDTWEIESTPAPISFHPLTLYGMGLLPKEKVPEVTLFDDQGQFNADDTGDPSPGTVVAGGTRSATVYNIIGMLGERSGPVPSQWRRATVVVSRDRLLTQREMDYWTFFAQRIEDPNRSGVVSYDGYGSFDLATGRGIDLQQDIQPRSAPAITQPLDVDYPVFGQSDLRDIELDLPLGTRYAVGQRVRISGRVTSTERHDFDTIQFRLWKYGGTSSDAIRIQARVSAAGTFVAERTLEAEQRGRYVLEMFLFWPDSGTQNPRAIVTPFFIN